MLPLMMQEQFREALDARLTAPEVVPRRILFLCARNACRSQMAEGFLRAWAPDGVEVHSAGLQPLGRVDPVATKVMDEAQVPLAGHACKPLSPYLLSSADLIIHLRADGEPTVDDPDGRLVEWEIEDPLGWPVDTYLEVRDEIAGRVRDLLDRIIAPETVRQRRPDSWTPAAPLRADGIPMTP